jgi:hypothetical protein
MTELDRIYLVIVTTLNLIVSISFLCINLWCIEQNNLENDRTRETGTRRRSRSRGET